MDIMFFNMFDVVNGCGCSAIHCCYVIVSTVLLHSNMLSLSARYKFVFYCIAFYFPSICITIMFVTLTCCLRICLCVT